LPNPGIAIVVFDALGYLQSSENAFYRLVLALEDDKVLRRGPQKPRNRDFAVVICEHSK